MHAVHCHPSALGADQRTVGICTTTFMHAEIALGKGRFADDVDSMLDALDVRAVTDLGRRAPPDGGIVVDGTPRAISLREGTGTDTDASAPR